MDISKGIKIIVNFIVTYLFVLFYSEISLKMIDFLIKLVTLG